MFKTEKIEKLLKYALLSGYIANDVPVSVMLISPPEHAKTSVIKGIKCEGAIETIDISPKIIVDNLLPTIRHEGINHVIITDLIKVLAHKSATVDSTVAFLNAGMEEGVQQGMFFGQTFSYDIPLRFGVITSVTVDYFYKYFRKWNDIGFITRFIPVSYKYSKTTVTEVHELIRNNELLTKYSGKTLVNDGIKKTLVSHKKKINVVIPDNVAAFIALQAQEIASKVSTFEIEIRTQGGKTRKIRPNMLGFRLQRQMRMLASAIALSNNRKEVDFTDAEELKSLLEFIGFPNMPKEI